MHLHKPCFSIVSVGIYVYWIQPSFHDSQHGCSKIGVCDFTVMSWFIEMECLTEWTG